MDLIVTKKLVTYKLWSRERLMCFAFKVNIFLCVNNLNVWDIRRGGSGRKFLSEPVVTGTTPLDRRPRASETVTLYDRSAALSKILGEVMRVYKMEADII